MQAAPKPDSPPQRKQRGVARLDERADFDEIIDVRSPAEFADDHIPGALSCPVLDDAQRAEVGTLYKQVSPFAAKKVGAAYISENIARHLRDHFLERPKGWRPLIVCWRGGMRSGAMTTVFRQIGWDACQLEGGYKAFRHHVLERLDALPASLHFHVLSGPTGSAKTRILQAAQAQGGQVLDLEGLACHKGSVLGNLPTQPQPSQKWFETQIWAALEAADPARLVFVEAESRKIGMLRLPEQLFIRMRQSPVSLIEATRSSRVDYLLRDYDYFLADPALLKRQLDNLRNLLGHEVVADWHRLIDAGDFRALTDALLEKHYDPLYARAHERDYPAGTAATPRPTRRLAARTLDATGIAELAEALIDPRC